MEQIKQQDDPYNINNVDRGFEPIRRFRLADLERGIPVEQPNGTTFMPSKGYYIDKNGSVRKAKEFYLIGTDGQQ